MNELKGKIVEIFDVETGVSKAGKNWVKQNFVIETDDRYPRKVCLNLFGDKTDMIQSKAIGDEVEVKYEIESREYNGKWFTNVNAQAVNLVSAVAEKKAPVVEDVVLDKNGLPPSESITHAEQYKRAVDVDTVEVVEDSDLPF